MVFILMEEEENEEEEKNNTEGTEAGENNIEEENSQFEQTDEIVETEGEEITETGTVTEAQGPPPNQITAIVTDKEVKQVDLLTRYLYLNGLIDEEDKSKTVRYAIQYLHSHVKLLIQQQREQRQKASVR